MFKPSFRRPKLRLLPIMLLAVFSMLSVKVSDLWTDFSDLSHAMSIQQNQAQAAETAAAASPADCQTAKLEDQPKDQSRFNQSEIDLLQALRSRRALLDQREKELNVRERRAALADQGKSAGTFLRPVNGATERDSGQVGDERVSLPDDARILRE